jgi:hypothetical protein
MGAMRILRPQLESRVRRFPPKVSAEKVAVRTLKNAAVGHSQLKALFRKINTCPAAGLT